MTFGLSLDYERGKPTTRRYQNAQGSCTDPFDGWPLQVGGKIAGEPCPDPQCNHVLMVHTRDGRCDLCHELDLMGLYRCGAIPLSFTVERVR